MSESWIKVRKNLRSDPHVLRLAALLKVHRLAAQAAYIVLWGIADEQTTDGRLAGWDAAMLDEEIGLPGVTEAMLLGADGKGGDPWLTKETDGTLAIPDFDRHMSEGAKRRAVDARRKERERDGAAASERERKRTGAAVRDSSEPVRTGLGPEKRREEKREEPSPSLLRSDTPPASPGGEFPRLADGPSVGQPSQEPAKFAEPELGETAAPAPGGLAGADLELARGMEAIAWADAKAGGKRAPGAVPDAPASRLTTARKGKPRAHGFEPFYAAYPRKEAPDAAERAFVRAVGRLRSRDPTLSAEAAAARIGERAAAFAKSDIARGPREFIPHPATWLNDGRFDDDDGEWRRDGDERGSGGGRGDAGPGQAPRGPAPGAGPGDRGRAALSRGAGAVRRT